MAKKKLVKKEKNYLPTLLIILVSLLIVMGLLHWRNERIEEKSMMMQKQMAQNPIDYLKDTDNDGVYTDAKYGFTFKYPKDVFKYQNGPSFQANLSEVYWDNQSDKASYLGGNKEGAYMRFYVNNADASIETMQNRFQDIYDHSVGTPNPQTKELEILANKLKNLSVPNGLGMTYISVDPRSPKSGAYSAAWMKDGNTYWLDVISNSGDKNGVYKKVFDSIVSSFKFTN